MPKEQEPMINPSNTEIAHWLIDVASGVFTVIVIMVLAFAQFGTL